MPFDETEPPDNGGGGDPAHDPVNLGIALKALIDATEAEIGTHGICSACLVANLIFNLTFKLAKENPDKHLSIANKMITAVSSSISLAIEMQHMTDNDIDKIIRRIT